MSLGFCCRAIVGSLMVVLVRFVAGLPMKSSKVEVDRIGQGRISHKHLIMFVFRWKKLVM